MKGETRNDCYESTIEIDGLREARCENRRRIFEIQRAIAIGSPFMILNYHYMDKRSFPSFR